VRLRGRVTFGEIIIPFVTFVKYGRDLRRAGWDLAGGDPKYTS